MSEQNPMPTNLFGSSHAHMRDFFVNIGGKTYAATQLSQWLYRKGVLDFNDMTNFGLNIRTQLKATAELRLPEFVESESSEDGTRKWQVLLNDGQRVESVFIPEARRGTLCISSQAGCVLDCSFCATGKQGFSRNLSAAEIVGQLWLARHTLNDFNRFPPTLTNVVFMGMGEPLLNFEEVATAIALMLDDDAFGLAARRVTISTAGVAPMIERIPNEAARASLAVSLHAPNDELRDTLVPLNKKYPIRDVLDSVQCYLSRMPRSRRSMIFQYTLIEGVNDDTRLAKDLARLLSGISCKINLIPFNSFPGSDYRTPSRKAIRDFQQVLKAAGYVATIRTTRGNDIAAACGRLVGSVQDRSARSSQHAANISPQRLTLCEKN